MALSSAGLAPLSPYSRKILNETVKTFAVFLSWMHLLDGEGQLQVIRAILFE